MQDRAAVAPVPHQKVASVSEQKPRQRLFLQPGKHLRQLFSRLNHKKIARRTTCPECRMPVHLFFC